MALQSHAPAVLLTRPAPQAARFATLLRDRLGEGVRIVSSPLLEPEFLAPVVPEGADALIFTSETGVEGYRRIADAPALAGLHRAWCVGDRTARAATAAGLAARSANGDAEALFTAILAAEERGPLLHLCGQETRGDLAARLTAAGVPTRAATVYRQRPVPLTEAAVSLLRGDAPVIVPLFSPRSATFFAAAAGTGRWHAPLRVAALSPAVAAGLETLIPQAVMVARHPDAAAMADAVVALFAAAPGA